MKRKGVQREDKSLHSVEVAPAKGAKSRDDIGSAKKNIGPIITSIEPPAGYPGMTIRINGKNFGKSILDNTVLVGGKKAIVYEASQNQLKVITDPRMKSGDVLVKVDKYKVSDAIKLMSGPSLMEELGPPLSSLGMDLDYKRNVPPHEGSLTILVVLVYPTDMVPDVSCPTPNDISNIWADVKKYYHQASYGNCDIEVTVTNAWYPLLKDAAYYVYDIGGPKAEIKQELLYQFWSEVAQAGYQHLSSFKPDIIVGVINLKGQPIRGFGGYSTSHFVYVNPPSGTNIDIMADWNTWGYVNLIAIADNPGDRPNSNWKWTRCAHEVGHCILSGPDLSASMGSDTLDEEDIYPISDYVGLDSSAAGFDQMGHHEDGPLFSGYNMEKLKFYSDDNIINIDWASFTGCEYFEVVSHGMYDESTGIDEKNTVSTDRILIDGNVVNVRRCNLVKIKICDGLDYFIEVRRTTTNYNPPPLFDGYIDQSGNPTYVHGGVVVTAVVTKAVNNNQWMRFITLLNDRQHTNSLINQTPPYTENLPMPAMKQGQTASDPLRRLKITVCEPINNNLSLKPLIYLVKLERTRAPTGVSNSRDLYFNRGAVSWESPDIFIDAFVPDGNYQNCDNAGNPVGCGDKPVVGRPNALHAVVHYKDDNPSGRVHAYVTYYYITPPGVGDNGIWTPREVTDGWVPSGGTGDWPATWVPMVGEHTCLKAVATDLPTEANTDNNMAQENVFYFDFPAADTEAVPQYVSIPIAVRNPLNERVLALLSFGNISPGFVAYFPHSRLWLGPLEERIFDLLITPTKTYSSFMKSERTRVKVAISGYILGSNASQICPSVLSLTRPSPIGGITIRAAVKREVKLILKGAFAKNYVSLTGNITPPTGEKEQVYVEIVDGKGNVWAKNVESDTDGRFLAMFDPSTRPQANIRKLIRKEKEKHVRGKRVAYKGYRGSAQLLYSRTAAQAKSNTVLIRKL